MKTAIENDFVTELAMLSSSLKRKTLESPSEQKSAKRAVRSFSFFVWKLWVIANYGVVEGALTRPTEIIRHSNDVKENVGGEPLTPRTLGQIIKDVFGSGVKLVKRGPNGNRYGTYLNVKRIQRKAAAPEPAPHDASWYSFQLPQNWSCVKDRREQMSFIRHEHWEFNKARGTTELYVAKTDSGYSLQVKCHGCIVDMKEDLGLANALDKITVQEQVRMAVDFIEGSALCLGFQMSRHEDVMALLPHVSGSFSLLTDEGEEQRRAFSASCLLFTPHKGSSCSNCSSLWMVDQRRKSRKEQQETIHPKCNKKYMSKEELQMQFKEEQAARRNAEKREDYWKERFLSVAVKMEDGDHEDIRLIFSGVDKSADVPEEMSCLWEQQEKILNTKSKCGYRWHPKIIKLCLDLYCKNPHVLDPLRHFIRLPSNRTIRHYKNKHEQKPGWNRDTVQWCLQEAKAKNLKESDYWGGLIFDEMKIEENVEMVVKGGKHRLVGFVDLGTLHEEMQKLEGKCETQLASHVLQFIFLSDCGYRFPIAQFPGHDCSPSDLYSLFWKGVLMMMEFGFTIYWCILDGAECNRKFIKMHFPKQQPADKRFVAFNMYTGGPMVFIVDCKHNFKKIRNNMEKSNLRVQPRCLTIGQNSILWSQMVDAYEFDQTKTSIHLHEKLTEQHFHLDPALKMRNHLAEDVLDKKMHYLMVVYQRHLNESGQDGSKLDATIRLLQHTSQLIEIFSTGRFAISNKDDTRLKELDRFLIFLTKWNEETSNNSKHFISNKLWFDLQSMIHGFRSIVNIKLARFPHSVIKAWIINQDVVENHFCQVRACNGQNNNPSYRLQESTQNSIRYGQSTISTKSNAGMCKTLF